MSQKTAIIKREIKREIKSFARRSGRLSLSQKDALTTLWPFYGIDYARSEEGFKRLTKQQKPIKLEIGFGNGDSLIEMAKNDPKSLYVGIEVHTPGVGRILLNIHQQNIDNLIIMSHDAVEILRDMVPNECLTRVFLFFPDPWHKSRHHKRRIVNEKFRNLLAEKLLKDGVIHIATDWQNYADQMAKAFLKDNRFKNLGNELGISPKPDYRPKTKFEKRGLRLKHAISDLLLCKK